jgi:hypothetical protein
MLFLRALREPHVPPPVNVELDERLDVVDKRLDRLDARDKLVANAYRRSDAALRRK